MRIATTMIWVSLIVMIAVAAGAIVLQIFLSRRERLWPGFILPGLSFLYSLLPVLGMAGYGGANDARLWVTAGMTWLLFNIPTFVLLTIHFACRRSRGRRKELERMRAQDLL